MIKIERGPEPEFFKSGPVKRAIDELSRMSKVEERQSRFKFDEKLLYEMAPHVMKITNGRCAYCETPIERPSVDQFRPKSGARGLGKEYAPQHYWWLAYEWTNLLPDCPSCNKHKRDYFPLENESKRCRIGAKGEELLQEGALLIDPTSENPEDHFVFTLDGLVRERSLKGKVTIDLLGLNRTQLVEYRKKVVREMNEVLPRYKKEGRLEAFLSYVYFTTVTSEPYMAVRRAATRAWVAQQESLKPKVKNIGALKELKISQKKLQIPITKKQATKVSKQVSDLKRFTIRTIEIENFKSIDHLKLDVAQNDKKSERESWLLLLGDNGIGKSSILQAIALALTGKTELKRLKLNPKEFLKRGTKSGFVKIHSYESDNPIELKITPRAITTKLTSSPTYVMGYGSTRLLPKGKLKSDVSHPKFTNIRNLFDYSVALTDANRWLKDLKKEEFNSRVASALFDLLALREKDRVAIEKGKLIIRQFNEDNALEDNSDGFKGVAAFAIDIMKTLAGDSANYHSSHGIVLVDELGNHLHPRWRMKIVEALRRTFPNLQFIVTTHEPLCLRGCQHGEVAVLVRDQNFDIRVLQRDLLPDHNLMRIEQLLTSDLFGLINVLDDETEKTYEEYYSLLSKREHERTDSEKNRIEELGSELAGKELQGSTPQLQVLYKVVNEEFVKKIREKGFKAKEELKKDTVQEVKKLINAKKIDWL